MKTRHIALLGFTASSFLAMTLAGCSAMRPRRSHQEDGRRIDDRGWRRRLVGHHTGALVPADHHRAPGAGRSWTRRPEPVAALPLSVRPPT